MYTAKFPRLAVALLALTTAGSALAMPPGQGGGKHFERLAQELELTQEQRSELQTLKQRLQPEMQQLREQGRTLHSRMRELDPGDSAYRGQVEQLAAQRAEFARSRTLLMSEMRAGLHAVLTEEQRAELAALKAQHREAGQQRRGQRRESGRTRPNRF